MPPHPRKPQTYEQKPLEQASSSEDMRADELRMNISYIPLPLNVVPREPRLPRFLQHPDKPQIANLN